MQFLHTLKESVEEKAEKIEKTEEETKVLLN
jgi:hypothetical protein